MLPWNRTSGWHFCENYSYLLGASTFRLFNYYKYDDEDDADCDNDESDADDDDEDDDDGGGDGNDEGHFLKTGCKTATKYLL